jgi:hypothetical protein
MPRASANLLWASSSDHSATAKPQVVVARRNRPNASHIYSLPPKESMQAMWG